MIRTYFCYVVKKNHAVAGIHRTTNSWPTKKQSLIDKCEQHLLLAIVSVSDLYRDAIFDCTFAEYPCDIVIRWTCECLSCRFFVNLATFPVIFIEFLLYIPFSRAIEFLLYDKSSGDIYLNHKKSTKSLFDPYHFSLSRNHFHYHFASTNIECVRASGRIFLCMYSCAFFFISSLLIIA